MEPEILRLGKLFHQRVQQDWDYNAEGNILIEHTIPLKPGQKRVKGTGCRLDLYVTETSDFISVIEIKSTDWDKVKPTNRRKLMAAHERQLWRYIRKFLVDEMKDVCCGIIYPSAPVDLDFKAEIETYMSEYGVQIVWYESSGS